MMEDTYRHKGMRRILVNNLRGKGITDERVLAAIETLPRHFFLDKAFEEQAYEDKPFPIGNDQTISQPYTVAYQSSLLFVEKRDRILEIGTGSGYQAPTSRPSAATTAPGGERRDPPPGRAAVGRGDGGLFERPGRAGGFGAFA